LETLPKVTKRHRAVRVVAPRNLRVVINGPGWRLDEGGAVSDNTPEGLSSAELDAQTGEELPDREAMSLIDANVAAPVNAAAALNVLSDDSVAIANAEQNVDLTQA
jgi:hypothetical protein